MRRAGAALLRFPAISGCASRAGEYDGGRGMGGHTRCMPADAVERSVGWQRGWVMPALHDPVMEVCIMPDPQNEPIVQAKLHWYRIPLDRAVLAELNQRSDAWGFAQTLGHLGIIIATGA